MIAKPRSSIAKLRSGLSFQPIAKLEIAKQKNAKLGAPLYSRAPSLATYIDCKNLAKLEIAKLGANFKWKKIKVVWENLKSTSLIPF